MLGCNRWQEWLLSLAAGQSMVPFADNRPAIRRLSRQVWVLRAAEEAAARRARPAAAHQGIPRPTQPVGS